VARQFFADELTAEAVRAFEEAAAANPVDERSRS
jgi:hypothetical protein